MKIDDLREVKNICYDCNIELYRTGKFDLYYELCICEKCGKHYKRHIGNKNIVTKKININKVIKEINKTWSNCVYPNKILRDTYNDGYYNCQRDCIQIIKDNIKEVEDNKKIDFTIKVNDNY